MDSRFRWLVIATVLTVALLAGCSAVRTPEAVENEQTVTVRTCESLPDYDYERMVERVEEIKGKELKRNLSICVEQQSGGIDTTPESGRFAYIEKPGLSFFGLDATTNSQQRSSLGHTAFSPSGGPIRIFLANEAMVGNVSWISYEGLVAHELSDAIEIPMEVTDNATTNERTLVPQTTDEVLAQQALANGVSMYVADLYVEQYGGHLNVSALDVGNRNWKRRLVQSLYYSGYRYSKRTNQQTISKTDLLNSTAQVLHSDETLNVTGFPSRPNLSMDSLEHVRTDRIGELFLRETLISKGVSSERAAAVADGWANDRMDYYRANGSTIVTWRVMWQSEDERTEFVETYDAVYDYQRVDTLRSITCRKSGRYLTASEKSVTVLLCDD